MPKGSAIFSSFRALGAPARWRGTTLIWLAAVALAAYAAGFLLFANNLPHRPGALGKIDGIVVLTGGGSRLDTAGALFEQGKGERLLITGVNPALSRRLVKALVHGGPRFDCCADIDRSAANTHGNAAKAAAWARSHGYHRLLVVTASYHIPRSLNEFRAAMPEMTLVPYPVDPEGVHLAHWYVHPSTIRLLQSEYDKFLGSEILSHMLGQQIRDALDHSLVENHPLTRADDVARKST